MTGKPKTLVVTVAGMIDAKDLEPLRSISEVEYLELEHISEEELASRCDGRDYLMLNYDVVKNLSENFYTDQRVQSLKAISTDITGMDWASPQSAHTNGVTLLNTPGYSTESVAETILAEVLLHSRNRHLSYVDAIKGREATPRKGINLRGRTAGIIGLGEIGQRTAELLAGVGMDLITWSRSQRSNFVHVELPELFDRADVACICVKSVRSGPDANTGFIDADLLERCNGTIIVNLARFDVVDHNALLPLLRSGHVSGYTVEQAPDLDEAPLKKLESVHLPPKDAWFSDESLQGLRTIWVGNIVSSINGREVNRYVD